MMSLLFWYKNLVLVAGGAGMTPFLAIIKNLLSRYELLQDGLPTNVHLVWCVRRRSELATLKTIKPAQIYPGYSYNGTSKAGGLNLSIRAYVTGEAVGGEMPPTETPMVVDYGAEPFPLSPVKGEERRNGESTVNSYQNLWMLALFMASSIGFVLMHALLYNYVSSPKLLKKGEEFSTAEESVLHFVSLFVGIVICGGSVILFWIARTRAAWSGHSDAAGGGQAVKMVRVADLEGNVESDFLDNCVVVEGTTARGRNSKVGAA